MNRRHRESSFSFFRSTEDLRQYISETRNWGRWGKDDQLGTLNLISPEVRKRASRLVARGVSVSLSRPIATDPSPNNPRPVLHYMTTYSKGQGAGVARDFVGAVCHGPSHTHIDALSHFWDVDGKLYNGIDAGDAITMRGAVWGGLDRWKNGIFTRGILLDVPAHRSEAYVTADRPVTSMELEEILVSNELSVEPGDAVVVYSGRDRWDEENPPWGSEDGRPGLDVSCIQFLRQYDCSALLWDMMDCRPSNLGLANGVHVAIPAYGLVLIDNAKLDTLVAACSNFGQSEFLLTINPLNLRGGTGALVNPIATF